MNDWPQAMAGGGVPASHGRISEHPKQKKMKRSGSECSLPQRETRQGLNLSIQQRVGSSTVAAGSAGSALSDARRNRAIRARVILRRGKQKCI